MTAPVESWMTRYFGNAATVTVAVILGGLLVMVWSAMTTTFVSRGGRFARATVAETSAPEALRMTGSSPDVALGEVPVNAPS